MINKSIFEESKLYMPGGVNSPVRAFKDMGLTPPVLKNGRGVVIEDEDGKEYIDFVLAWGPLLLGHCPKLVTEGLEKQINKGLAFGAPTLLELKMSEFLCKEIKSLEMVRMVNSGTEATMSAIKLARGYTKKNKIIKFAGCYHGHFDGFLVEAGSGVLTEGIAGSLGVPDESIKNTLVCKYNDISSIEEAFKLYGDDIAGVIIEPVAGNMGVIKAKEEFLKSLRELCDEYNSLLIYDEVMSGFRVGYEGAQGLSEIKPDLVTYAKVIGGGLPCGAYGGRKEIMENLSPLGGVYQAGTMSGNPLVMTAGLTTLEYIKENKNAIYENIEIVGEALENGLKEISKKYNIQLSINRVGGMMTVFFTNKETVETYEDVKTCDLERFKRYFIHMLNGGIYLPPSQFEAVFLSSEHNMSHVEKFLKLFKEFCEKENEK